MDAARHRLLLHHSKSFSISRSGIERDEITAELTVFLRYRISDGFQITKGDVIDCYHHRTGQLDIVIYDKLGNCSTHRWTFPAPGWLCRDEQLPPPNRF